MTRVTATECDSRPQILQAKLLQRMIDNLSSSATHCTRWAGCACCDYTSWHSHLLFIGSCGGYGCWAVVVVVVVEVGVVVVPAMAAVMVTQETVSRFTFMSPYPPPPSAA